MPSVRRLTFPYQERVTRVREALREASLDALLVTHPPNLRYLTGLDASTGLVVVTKDACTLVVDFRYASAARRILDQRPPGELTVEVAEGSVDTWLAADVLRAGALRIGIEAASMPVSRFTRLSAALAAAVPAPFDRSAPCPALVPTERVVEAVRLLKDAAEIAVLREAGRRLSRVAARLPEFARPGRSERAVAAHIEAAMRAEGFDRPAFDTIVASGPNSALPHARPSGRLLEAGEGVVLDFGGVYDGYCVDLTRTVRLGRQPAELRRLFAAVAEAHAASLAAVRPGALPSAIDGAARRVLEGAGLGAAFGHGTGHGLGLEVHEEPRIGRRIEGQDEAPVEPGMVFTIEPGAYVPGLGGARIEDDVLVIEDGCELLTRVPVEVEGHQRS